MKYTTTLRLNYKQQPCVAPYIDGYNVWDIPKDYYTESVEAAVKNAYLLGVRQTINKLRVLTQDLEWNEKFE